MNKTDFFRAVADAAAVSHNDVRRVLQAFERVVARELRDGGSVVWPGFGTFAVTQRAERKGRNPQTGEAIMLPAHKTPKFKPGQPLKDAVNA